MARIKKGDTVIVLSGKDRGKSGKVLEVWPELGRAMVERINLTKHFERRSQQNPQGGIVEREGSLALSKLALSCARCGKPTRVGWETSANGQKQRVCCHCKQLV